MTTEKLVAGPLRGALDKKAEEWLEVCGKIMAGTGAVKPDAEDLSYADALRHCAAEVMSILALASLPSSQPPPLDLSEEEIAGIRRGLADVAAGRVKSLEQIETDLALPSSPPAQDACICSDDEHSPECALAAASPVQGVQATNLQVGHEEKRGDLCEGNSSGLLTESPSTFAAGQRVEGAEATHLSVADLQPLKDACDRQWESETPLQIIAIAANAIHWRGVARKQEITDALMSNNQLEQLLFANWTGGTSPAHSINIKVLAEDIAKLLNALATPAAPPVAEKTELDRAADELDALYGKCVWTMPNPIPQGWAKYGWNELVLPAKAVRDLANKWRLRAPQAALGSGQELCEALERLEHELLANEWETQLDRFAEDIQTVCVAARAALALPLAPKPAYFTTMAPSTKTVASGYASDSALTLPVPGPVSDDSIHHGPFPPPAPKPAPPAEQDFYASYAKRCAIQRQIPLTYSSWKRQGRKNAPNVDVSSAERGRK